MFGHAEMKAGSYKLLRQSDGIGLYAEVFVQAFGSQGHSTVTVAPDAFAWLKDEYGPDAWEWPVCDDYRDGATAGCQYALNHTSHGPIDGLRVVISRINAHPAHSTWDAVAYASCFALWDAIQDTGTDHPELVAGKIQKLRRPSKAMDDDRE